jgi:hypothetical protein
MPGKRGRGIYEAIKGVDGRAWQNRGDCCSYGPVGRFPDVKSRDAADRPQGGGYNNCEPSQEL